MHPYLIEQLAEARRRELRAGAARAAARSTGTRPRYRSARQRAGWVLIEIGLRLARGPALDETSPRLVRDAGA